VHPGVIPTELTRHFAGFLHKTYQAIGSLFVKTIPQGAATTVYVATAPEVEDKAGLYFADCNVCPSPNQNINDEVALKLWELSEKAVGPKESTDQKEEEK